MAYMRRTVRAGSIAEYKKMHTIRANCKGGTRGVAVERTTEAQMRVNERKAEERLRWRLNANFRPKDYHLVLHYADKARTLEQCWDDRKKFLRIIRDKCKKAGIALMYIAVTETKRMTNIHHHIILNKMDLDMLQDAWASVDGTGGISLRPLDNRGNHAKLASYLIKESRSTMARLAEAGIRGKRFVCSQNLEIPVPVYEKIEANHWTENPKPHKGAYLYKWDNGETVLNGISDETGMPYQEYFEIYELPPDDEPRGKKRRVKHEAE